MANPSLVQMGPSGGLALVLEVQVGGAGAGAAWPPVLTPLQSVCRCLKNGVADVAFLDHLAIMNATGKLLARRLSS